MKLAALTTAALFTALSLSACKDEEKKDEGGDKSAEDGKGKEDGGAKGDEGGGGDGGGVFLPY